MQNRLFIPAISREVTFIARNVSEANEIYDGDNVDEVFKRLTKAVYDRADEAVQELLLELEEEVELVAKGIVRIEWVNSDRRLNWGNYGRVYNAHGRKKRIGWAGLYLECNEVAPRLIACVNVRGGRDGRRTLVRACRAEMSAKVASDHPKEYPEDYSECVIWFDEKLTHATCRDQLRQRLRYCARRFFKVVKRIM